MRTHVQAGGAPKVSDINAARARVGLPPLVVHEVKITASYGQDTTVSVLYGESRVPSQRTPEDMAAVDRSERNQAAWAIHALAGVRVAKARRYLDGEPVSGLARRMCDSAARELGLLHHVRPAR